MKLTDLLYPSCHLCRTLRASMCAGAIIVLATYMLQLLNINHEMKRKEQA